MRALTYLGMSVLSIMGLVYEAMLLSCLRKLETERKGFGVVVQMEDGLKAVPMVQRAMACDRKTTEFSGS